MRERKYVLDALCKLATAFPDWTISIKPRSRRGARGIAHSETYFYQDIYKCLISQRPSNLFFDYRPIEDLLPTTDLCLTVGSTVAIESLALGIPTGVISDFGIRSEYGNHHFAGSGCLISFQRLLNGHLPMLRKEWLNAHLGLPRPSPTDVVVRVNQLLDAQVSMGKPLPLRPMFYTPEAHGYLFEDKSQRLASVWRSCSYALHHYGTKLLKALR